VAGSGGGRSGRLPPLRVLLTNVTLASRTGTELFVKEVARELLRRGHSPVVYTPEPGEVADEIRAATVPVVTDLSRLAHPPDVVHGHHHQQTMAALLRFPRAAGVFVAHDWSAWHDAPPIFPRLYRYVAVDETVRDRLLSEGVPAAATCVLLNWVDLDRFAPRGPLPGRPRRALVFSNYARPGGTLSAVESACREAGLELEVLGAGVGRSVPSPETHLREFDLVFAKGRAALEALAVGCAVVLWDVRGLGPMVTTEELPVLRARNFGRRALWRPVTAEAVRGEIDRYHHEDAAEVSRRVRAEAGMREAIDRWVDLYREVIAQHSGARSEPEAELRAAGDYLQTWAGWKPTDWGTVEDLRAERRRLLIRIGELERALAAADPKAADPAEERVRSLSERVEELEGLWRSLSRRLGEATSREDEMRAELLDARRARNETSRLLDEVAGTTTWRLRTRLLEAPGVKSSYRRVLRLLGRPLR
jgi:hypothetical protein